VPIKIPFVADVAAFLAGTRNITDSLDDVGDALDDVSRHGDATEKDTSANLDGIADEADESADRIRKSFKQAFDAVEKSGNTSTRRVRDDVDDVGRKGSATLHEFGEEAKQNVAESVSSFTGSAESAVDAVQSTFGGLVSALGPAGLVGAAVAGVGIGLARGLFAKSQEAVTELSERVASLTGDLIEAGRAAPGFEQIGDGLKALATEATTTGKSIGNMFTGEASTKLLDLQHNAEAAGISFADMALGLSGNSAAVNKSLAEIATRQAEINQLTSQAGTGAAAAQTAALYAGETAALEKSKTALEGKRTELDASRRAYEAYLEIQKQNVDNEKAVADAARTSIEAHGAAATAAYTHATASEIQAAAAGDAADEIERKNAKLHAEAAESLAASNAAIAYQQAVDDTTAAIKANGETHDLNTAKGRANQTALNGLASSLLAVAQAREEDTGKTSSYNRVIEKNRGEFIDAAEAAGYSRKEAKKLADQYGLIPKKVKTDVNVTDNGTSKSTGAEIDHAARSRTTPVNVQPNLSGFDASVQKYLNGKAYYVTLRARPGHNVMT
jgi:hypothetical protein